MGEPYVHGREWSDMFYEGVLAGRTAGKSYIGAVRHFLYAHRWPGSVNLICAPNYTTIRRGTLPALERVLNSQKLFRGQHYEFNKTDMEITYLWNGSRAPLVSLDDENAARSIRAASAWVDEPGYVSWEAFAALQPTMTQVGYPHQLWMTGTSAGKFHWTYPFFFPREAFDDEYTDRDIRAHILAEHGSEFDDYSYRLIQDPENPGHISRRVCMFAKTRDNPYGGIEEDQELAAIYGRGSAIYGQEAEGRFTVQQGLVYPGWNAARFMVPEKLWPTQPTRHIAAIDFGWEAPTAILVGGIDDAGRAYLREEFYRSHFPLENLANVCKHLRRKYNIRLFFVDAADARSKAYLKSAGIPIWNADKDVGRAQDIQTGIGLFSWMLGSRVKDGSQRLYLNPGLKNFRAEIENYVKEEQKLGKGPTEIPRKRRDHLMDCARYLFAGMRRLGWLDPRRDRTMHLDMRIQVT